VDRVLRPFEETDLAALGVAIFIGVLAGTIVSIPLGHMRFNIGTTVGTFLAGSIVGRVRSLKPWFARIPGAAILFMSSLGLAAFIAMVGLKAGPGLVNAFSGSGYLLLIGGMIVTLVPLISGIFFGPTFSG